MPFWDRWTSPAKKQIETKAVLGTSDTLGKFMQMGAIGASTASSALSLYETSSAVAIPITMIVDSFKILHPILLIDDKRQPDHPVIELLRKPSPHFSLQLFQETIAKDYLITGETNIVALGNIQVPPKELMPVSPRAVTVPMGAGGYPSRYSVAGNILNGSYLPDEHNGEIRYYNGLLREMWQIRGYSTRDGSLLRAQSKLVSVSKEIRQHILGTTHNVSLLEKGGRITLILNFESDLGPDEYTDLVDRVRAEFGGAAQAGEILVTAGPAMKAQEAGVNNRDMDFAQLHKMAGKAVAQQYRVPLPLVSDERQTLNNYTEGRLAIYDDAVIPLADVLYGGMSEMLLPRFNLDPRRARLTFDPDKIGALVRRRNEEVKLRKDIGIETDNELRALLSREPYVGGDIVYKQANFIPAGTDPFTDDNDPLYVEDVDN